MIGALYKNRGQFAYISQHSQRQCCFKCSPRPVVYILLFPEYKVQESLRLEGYCIKVTNDKIYNYRCEVDLRRNLNQNSKQETRDNFVLLLERAWRFMNRMMY